jgi:hypothetical protein
MPQICEPIQTCPNVFEPFLLLSMIRLISRMTKTLKAFLLVTSDFLGDLLNVSVSFQAFSISLGSSVLRCFIFIIVSSSCNW